MDESKSKEVPVSKLVNVSDLSSSILGFRDAELNWVTVPHLEKNKTNIFIKEILSGHFLTISRLKLHRPLC